jgi:hypothetical protein
MCRSLPYTTHINQNEKANKKESARRRNSHTAGTTILRCSYLSLCGDALAARTLTFCPCAISLYAAATISAGESANILRECWDLAVLGDASNRKWGLPLYFITTRCRCSCWKTQLDGTAQQ